jgi:hypothetical protein
MNVKRRNFFTTVLLAVGSIFIPRRAESLTIKTPPFLIDGKLGPTGNLGPSGPVGAPGPCPVRPLGPSGPTGWSACIPYNPGDIIQCDGSSYVVIDCEPKRERGTRKLIE